MKSSATQKLRLSHSPFAYSVDCSLCSVLEVILLAGLFLLSMIGASADLVRKEVPTAGDPSEKNILWFRDGFKIMTECPRGGKRSVQVTISPVDVNSGRAALVFSISSGRISRMSGGPALATCKFFISDRTADGSPDLLEIYDRKTGKLIEAYTIVNDVVEPIPSKMLEEFRSGFFPDDQNIVRYIKKRESEPAGRGDGDKSSN